MSSRKQGAGYQVSATLSGSGHTVNSAVAVTLAVTYDPVHGAVSFRGINLGTGSFIKDWNSGILLSTVSVSGPITKAIVMDITDGYDLNLSW